MKKLISFWFGLLSAGVAFAALQTPIDSNFAFDGTNVQVIWNAYPGKSYVIQTTTNVAGMWSNLPALTATTNSIASSFPVTAKAQFYRVVKLDTEGPEITQTSPLDGAIAVSRQSAVQVWFSDVTGINTHSLTLTIGTNAPMSLPNPRLVYSGGVLTYTPATNVFLGTNGQIVVATISVADTLGNLTTNFTWSFQIELPAVPGTNILFISGTNGLVLVSTNGDYFTFSYPGFSSGLSNGLHLINTNLFTGYSRTVVSFTDYPASNTVVTLTRQTKLAELLELGSLSSVNFTELTGTQSLGGMHLSDKSLVTGIDFNHSFNLKQVLFQNANLTVEFLTNSYLSWNGKLEISANFQKRRLTQFASRISGQVDFRVEAHVGAQGALDSEYSANLYTSPPMRFGALIPTTPPIPVWFDAIVELNAGYSNHLQGSVDYTNGVQGAKEFLFGNRWDLTNGWSIYLQNPPLELTYLVPRWSAQASDNLHIWVQPRLKLLAFSAVGIVYDLQPYNDLNGRYQSNPYEYELALYGGLTGGMGVDLGALDDYLPPLPYSSREFIPRTLLWETNNFSNPPQISSQPQDQWVTAGNPASFTVAANGPGPLTYRWQRYGLYLSDDSHITGTRSSTLQINRCSTNDVGNYRALVSNPNGNIASQGALLTVYPTNLPFGMMLIPAGTFQMGDSLDGDTNALPVHSVFVSAFHMDKYEVSKALWDNVYQWATNHDYSFSYPAGSGKAANHPAHGMKWLDAVKWCNARSEKEARTPAYYTSAAQTTVYRSGQVAMDNSCVQWNAGYRLPTEAEWEKAARGGASGHRFPWTDSDNITHSRANYYSSASYAYDTSPTRGYHPTFNDGVTPYTSPVGYFAPNGYGLYDMAGNEGEWCWDWIGAYSSGSQTDPRGPASGSFKVARGGYWAASTSGCRAADRGCCNPGEGDSVHGFRSVLPLGQ